MGTVERHATRADTTPDPEAEGYVCGGYWSVRCLTCGWEKEGRYRPGREPEGLKLANTWGDMHETQELMKEVERRG